MYDPAGNLQTRTNNALIQNFAVNNLNQLTTNTRSGTLTVSGNFLGAPTNATVNALTALRYAHLSFAREGFTITNGNNTFTAVAYGTNGLRDTNTVSVNLPATNTFIYDANGNLTGRPSLGMALEYDDENQLTRMTVTNQWRSEFTYDGKMRLRVRKEYTWAGYWLLESETRMIYDGMLCIQERNANNAPQISYTRGRDLSGSREGAGGIGGLLAMTDYTQTAATVATAYYHADGNGNVTALVNTNQIIVARYSYDPYGNTLSISGPRAEVNRYRFSSKELHARSGFIYYGYRWYVPELQRWLNRDPIGDYAFFRQRVRGLSWEDKQALRAEARRNHYMFVWNRPTIAMDSEGLESWIPYWNPNGDGRPIGVPTVDMPCARAIKETLEMVELGNRGYEGYPAANADDKLQHCMTSCRLARDCGRGVAWLLGWLKESNDLIHGGTAGETVGDLNANTHGRNGKNCPQKSCEDYCRETRSEY